MAVSVDYRFDQVSSTLIGGTMIPKKKLGMRLARRSSIATASRVSPRSAKAISANGEPAIVYRC
jgi:hypothetical protein